MTVRDGTQMDHEWESIHEWHCITGVPRKSISYIKRGCELCEWEKWIIGIIEAGKGGMGGRGNNFKEHRVNACS